MATYSPHILIFNLAETFGGAERATLSLAKGLSEKGWKVSLLSKQEAIFWEPYLKNWDGDIYCFQWSYSFFPKTFKQLFKECLNFKNILKEIKPDLVLAFKHNAAALSVLTKKIFKLKNKVIVSPRGPTRLGIKIFFPHEKFKWYFLSWYFSHFCDALITPSHGLLKEHVNFFKAKPEKAFYIPNGIPLERYSPASKNPSCPQIIWCGRLSPEKIPEVPLRALAKIKKLKWQAFFIGEGPLYQKVKKIISELDLEKRIILKGFQKDPFYYLKEGDIFIHSSLLEGFGYSILEAMIKTLAPIVSDCPYGPREILANGKYGYLYKTEDELSSILKKILSHKSYYLEMGNKAKKRASKYSEEKMVKNYLKVLGTIL